MSYSDLIKLSNVSEEVFEFPYDEMKGDFGTWVDYFTNDSAEHEKDILFATLMLIKSYRETWVDIFKEESVTLSSLSSLLFGQLSNEMANMDLDPQSSIVYSFSNEIEILYSEISQKGMNIESRDKGSIHEVIKISTLLKKLKRRYSDMILESIKGKDDSDMAFVASCIYSVVSSRFKEDDQNSLINSENLGLSHSPKPSQNYHYIVEEEGINEKLDNIATLLIEQENVMDDPKSLNSSELNNGIVAKLEKFISAQEESTLEGFSSMLMTIGDIKANIEKDSMGIVNLENVLSSIASKKNKQIESLETEINELKEEFSEIKIGFHQLTTSLREFLEKE